ncbi:hypothetical protein B0H11DRAFT_1923031 [Mycena galericulata]|nr:hypothetical protein B0H11DRAFT_1923031 [Mycena galericulata]
MVRGVFPDVVHIFTKRVTIAVPELSADLINRQNPRSVRCVRAEAALSSSEHNELGSEAILVREIPFVGLTTRQDEALGGKMTWMLLDVALERKKKMATAHIRTDNLGLCGAAVEATVGICTTGGSLFRDLTPETTRSKFITATSVPCPGPWLHSGDLEYLPGHLSVESWSDFRIVSFLEEHVISIPPYRNGRSDPLVVISSRGETMIVTMGYHLTAAFLAHAREAGVRAASRQIDKR